MEYNLSDSHIEYTTTNDYRRILRNIFHMDINTIIQSIEKQYDIKNMDEETLDELLYDSDKMDNTLSILFDKTAHNVNFDILYEKAAALMLSSDKTIGQCVLFSYDYFSLFHMCLYDYFVNNVFNETTESFILLHNKLTK